MNPNNLESILLVTSKNPENRRFGTGFVIYHFANSSWVVKCAHVVNDVGGEITLEINGNPAKIVGIGASDELDLSLLETEKRLDTPVIKLGTFGRYGSPFTTAGFQLFGKHYSIKRIVGKLVQQNELVSKSLSERIKVWTITILGDDTLQDGYSGAPIIDDESGYCVGVISYKQGDGKNGLAISIDELEKILPTAPLDLIKRTTSVDESTNHLDYLFKKATRLQITGELQDSLELFREIKYTNPSYPRIDMMINSVERELRQSYAINGRVRPDVVMSPPAMSRPPVAMERQAASPSFFAGIGCVLILILIVVVVLGYFLLRWWFGW